MQREQHDKSREEERVLHLDSVLRDGTASGRRQEQRMEARLGRTL